MKAKWFRILLVFSILMIGLTPMGGALAQEGASFTATPLFPDSTISVEKSTSADAHLPGMVSVIVKLQGDSLAAYAGGIAGLSATSPSVTKEKKLNPNSKASKAYLKYLDQKHQNFKSAALAHIPQGQVTQDLELILNSVAMVVPADQVSNLYALPDVEAVYADELLQVNTDNSPQFIGAPTVWSQLGGQESSGEGVIVGVLDTGVWPEHPSFSDPDPSGKPYAAPPPPLSGSRACEFTGGANPGPAFACNNKLIGADRFMATYDAVIGLMPTEFTTARDDDGHGTHTSSTAAGNASVQASIFGVSRGAISGIAPRAHVIMYKVCGERGCFSSDSAAAIQKAIQDGVDVINFSISGGTNPYSDSVELAFLDAYNAGVFVAASAGNSGPASDTTAHRGPWVTTVAASTQDRAFENTVSLTGDGGATLSLAGVSLTAGISTPTPLVSAADAPYNDPFCANATPDGAFTGKIVVCQRGAGIGRIQKGFNVKQRGAVGMILYNNAANVTDQETDNHYLPASHIQFADGQDVLSFLSSHTGVQATLTAGEKVAAQGDVIASFSSRGGTGQTLGVSKPDITAPGVQILAGDTPAPAGAATGAQPAGELFQAIAGTSMSSPHIAGSAALLAALHSDWTPGQIKSALMTTAWTQVVKEDGATPANAFDFGSGRVNLNVAGDPGLTFDVAGADYIAHAVDLWNVNYPSIFLPTMPGVMTLQRTAHSVLNVDSTWELKVSNPSASDFKITVPGNVVVPAGGNLSINIAIDASNVPLGQVRMATLYMTQEGGSGERTIHIPITFIRKEPVITLSKTCTPASFKKGSNTSCSIAVQNTTFSTATVNVTDQLPKQLKLVAGSVVGGSPSGNGVVFNGTLAGAQPPDITIGAGGSPAGGYLPLSAFGIPPIGGVTDDSVTNFNVPAFTYAGETYSRLGVGSNGYLVVGGSSSAADIQFLNQQFPNPARPNNVLAAFWTDFNPPAGGALRIGTLTDGSDTWIVVDWAAVREFSLPRLDSFQIWIGVDGDANPGQDISYAYGTIQGNGDGGFMTTGAENRFGNRGANYYYNGAGTLPAFGTQLVVSGTPGIPGETHIISFSAQGVKVGPWVNYAQMTSNLFQGTSVASFAGTVTK